MSIHKKKQTVESSYSINGEDLEKVKLQRDLGVWFDEKIDFNTHFEKAVTRCTAIMGLIKKIDQNRMAPQTVLLYNALVRSILEYGRIVWDRHSMKVTRELESIQKQMVIYALRKSRGTVLWRV